MKFSLQKEIILILIFKTTVIWLIWHAFFANPISKRLTEAAIANRFGL